MYVVAQGLERGLVIRRATTPAATLVAAGVASRLTTGIASGLSAGVAAGGPRVVVSSRTGVR